MRQKFKKLGDMYLSKFGEGSLIDLSAIKQSLPSCVDANEIGVNIDLICDLCEYTRVSSLEVISIEYGDIDVLDQLHHRIEINLEALRDCSDVKTVVQFLDRSFVKEFLDIISMHFCFSREILAHELFMPQIALIKALKSKVALVDLAYLALPNILQAGLLATSAFSPLGLAFAFLISKSNYEYGAGLMMLETEESFKKPSALTLGGFEWAEWIELQMRLKVSRVFEELK